MAGPSIGTWVKVKNKSGRLTARVMANKFGGGSYEQGQVITQSEYNSYKENRAERLAQPELPSGESTTQKSSAESAKKVSESSAKLKQWVEKNESQSINVKTHGMPGGEKMSSIEFRGLKIYYPPNDEGRGRAVAAMQAIAAAKLPPGLTRHTKNIAFSTQDNKHDEYWAKKYEMPGFQVKATGGKGAIVAYGGRELSTRTLAHEMGHNLGNAKWGTPNPPAKSRYAAAQKKEPPVSDYGKKSPAEEFADAVAMFAANPQAFRKQYPLKSEAIAELIQS